MFENSVKEFFKGNGVFIKKFNDRDFFNREYHALKMFSKYDWCIPYKRIDEKELIIEYPYIRESCKLKKTLSKLSDEEKEFVLYQIIKIVKDIFVEGYAHRDLHIDNMYYIDSKVILYDYEWVYQYTYEQYNGLDFWESIDVIGKYSLYSHKHGHNIDNFGCLLSKDVLDMNDVHGSPVYSEGISYTFNIQNVTELKDIYKKYNKKILFIASHLSTGGMPEFLWKRIHALTKYTDCDIWVVEYSLYSDYYTAQRNKIKDKLGDKFISLGWLTNNAESLETKYEKLKSLIDREQFDIIHFDDVPESYDTFNGIDRKLLDWIYDSNRTYKIVETCHNAWFNANSNKKWIPDGFMHCSNFSAKRSFSDFTDKVPMEVVEYPIYDRTDELEGIENPFDNGRYNIINVGIWTPGKNQKEAVEIARYLDKHYPNQFTVHFIGGLAPNFKDYWQPILDNIPNNVKIWDSQLDVRSFYRWADLVLFNSTYELNPIILKEAVSYGKRILMRGLAIYNGTYDSYVSYLVDDIEKDSKQIVDMVKQPVPYDVNEFGTYEFKKMALDMIKFYENIKGVNRDIEHLNENTKKNAPIQINVNFVEGAFCEIVGTNDGTSYAVDFINKKDDSILFSTTLSPNHWASPVLKYCIDWKIRIRPDNPDYEQATYEMNLENKSVMVQLDSKAIGDTIAWIPYVEEFRKKHNCKLYCSTFHNHLFENKYRKLHFVKPDETVSDLYAKYYIGWFYGSDGKFDWTRNPNEFVSQPLQKTASDILGLEYKEIRPEIKTFDYNGNLPKRYFTYSLQSTAQAKYWNRPNGWYDLFDLLSKEGLVGICVDKHKSFGNDNYMNTIPSNSIDKTGLSLKDTIGVIKGAEFHIGVSSGLSWLAWAMGKKVVVISGFTEPILEFTTNCVRIFKDSVCNGCFTNPEHKFDASDWEWCPVHKGTNRQFECTKVITAKHVFEKIKQGQLL